MSLRSSPSQTADTPATPSKPLTPLASPTPTNPFSPPSTPSTKSQNSDIFISALYSILSTIPHPSLSRAGPVKEGVLTKHRADVFGSWKVKYCKVEVGLFTYSDSRKDPRAKSIVLGKRTVCKAIQAPREHDTLLNTAMKPISSMKGSSKDYFFLLSGGDGKELVFSTKSKVSVGQGARRRASEGWSKATAKRQLVAHQKYSARRCAPRPRTYSLPT